MPPQVSLPPSGDDLLLPRPPGLLRRYLGRHPLSFDITLAALTLLAEYLQAWGNDGLGTRGDPYLHMTWPIVLLGCSALVWRRSHPLLVVASIAACGCVLTVLHQPFLLAAIIVAVYSVAVFGRVRNAWIGSVGIVGTYLVAAFVIDGGPGSNTDSSSILVVGLAFALLVGINVGNRKRYLDALLDRAAQLARERDQQGQLATAAERARIAREMHDVVAHGLSVMIRLSDGADAIATSNPDRSREAVRQIGEVGRSSLRDMRRLLGVLRDDDQVEFTPQPDLTELEQLVESYRAAGLPVAVRWSGEAPSDTSIQVAVYRAVQEALTNALRYSREPSRVLVQLRFTPRSVNVEVTDDGINLGRQPSVGGGSGLVGLRERAAAFGGTVEAGPAINAETGQDGGGWRVRMTLPIAIEGAP